MIYDMLCNKLEEIKNQNKKRIVFPESEDLRVLKAASFVLKNSIALISLIGNEDEIKSLCFANDIDITGAEIIDNLKSEKLDKYAHKLHDLRKHKGVDLNKSYELLKSRIYFATMMLEMEDADGMVCGAVNTTTDSIKPALEIIKTKDEINIASSFFLMQTSNNGIEKAETYIFADCGLIQNPTEDDMVDIITQSVKTFKTFFKDEPKVSLLSYYTLPDDEKYDNDKYKKIIKKVKQISDNKDLLIEGPVQLDTAINGDVSIIKLPDSKINGNANILIFPNLEAGNIGYKIAQRFGNMEAIGPILQGLRKPVNDLSRGCSIDDIINVVVITCIQASNNI